MVARLRHNPKPALVGLIVTTLLLGSAWLAYAFAAPSGGSYPVIAAKVTGHGFITPCQFRGRHMDCSHVEFNIKRNADGAFKGSLTIICDGTTPPGDTTFHAKAISDLSIAGNVAQFSATGTLTGKENKGLVASVDVMTTDNEDGNDMFLATVRGASLTCTPGGIVTNGDVEVQLGKNPDPDQRPTTSPSPEHNPKPPHNPHR